MPNNIATRRFLAVDVGEISVVDDNAIEKPVAVTKRKETNSMNTADNKNKKEGGKGSSASETDVSKNGKTPDDKTVVVERTADEDVVKRLLDAATALVEKSSSTEPSKPEGESVSSDVVKAALEKAGLDDAQIAKALGAIAEPTPMPTAAPETDVSKALQKEESEMQFLEALSASIAKAKSFTPTRIGELNSMADTLNGLLSELNGVSDVEKGKAPSQPAAPAQEPAPANNSEAVMKSLLDAMPGVIAETVKKALEPLTSEVEALKSTRTPPTSGTTDDTKAGGEEVNATKSKSLWSGVL